jgi:hypothetical protein
MANLFGKNYSKRDLLRLVGDMSQIAGINPVELINGNERGVRALEIKTGSGLEFFIMQDRALDIFEAKFNGCSLCWHAPAGPVAPAFYDPYDIGWLWSFPGGLLHTCGLSNVGVPNEDNDEELGLHGRVSHIPAKNVSFGSEWEDDEYILWVTGEVREVRLSGTNLLLRRSIHARLGQSRIWIKDVIENQGYKEAPLMLLYHCNMGFPVLDEGAELFAVVDDMQPRDEAAAHGAEVFDHFEAPQPGFAEQCFFIDHDADEKGVVNTALVNRRFNNNQGIGVYLSYPKAELPRYTQWKMVAEGTYVVGMEPGNCIPEGRASARQNGRLTTLLPGELATFHIEIGVLASSSEIRAFEARLRGLEG